MALARVRATAERCRGMSYDADAADSDRAAAARWAWERLQHPETLILDTETTGLGSLAEIVQIAVINLRGDVLLNRLVRPVGPIPEEASRIHGITLKHLEDAPPFRAVGAEVLDLIAGKDVLIYNAAYDTRLLRQSAAAVRLKADMFAAAAMFQCVMQQYSAWVGDWNDYYGNYKWQRLPGGDHSALGDCQATRKILFTMAGLDWLCD
jgi:DNA polymerase-3 subunit epsilon